MESCSFQSQLLSVMEVLAKAAVAEINRRVDDSCAVIRLEVSQSRREIELLKSKCESMEAELRRSRMRARRRVVYPPAAGRLPPLVEAVLNTGSRGADWDRRMDPEAPDQPQQCVDMEATAEAEQIQIKEECAEEDMWRKDPPDKLISGVEPPPVQAVGFVDCYHSAENPAEYDSVVPLAAADDAFPELGQNGTEHVMKHEKEEELDENEAPNDSGHKPVTGEGDDQLWLSNLCRDAGDPSFSYVVQQFEQIPTVFAPQSEDVVPRIHPVEKSHSALVNAALVKRRVRTFGCKRPQADDGHGALSQLNAMDQSSIPQQPQHQHRDLAPPPRNRDEDLMGQNPAPSSLCGHSRCSFTLARRMRTPWRSGVGEKRFSCTYCDKSFMRFSQLKEHLRSHTGEKPFSCLQCGRSFTKQCNLIRHAVVHSGEKPHECSLCGKCFTQRSSLKSHQKTAH